MATKLNALKPFLDEGGRLISLPAKYKKQLLAFWYLSEKIEAGRQYAESEINDLLDEWSCFHDPATLRRALCDSGLLNRTADCKCYWKNQSDISLEEFLQKHV